MFYRLNTNHRQELDEKNTRIAVLTLLRCKKLKCILYNEEYEGERIADIAEGQK